MSSYHEMQYHDMCGNYELIGAFLGVVAGTYFSQELSSYVQAGVKIAGLAKFITTEPVITKIACSGGGLLGGYFAGKLLSKIIIHFRRKTDDKKIKKEFNEKSDWVRQNQERKGRSRD